MEAAGVIGELTRRRALQHRTRRTGHRIPLPATATPAAYAERTLRAATPPVSIAGLQQALLNLASRCYATEQDLPHLAAITLSPHDLRLHLSEDDPNPVPPFTATDARTWTTTHDALAADTPIPDDGRGEPFPALVTLGHTTDATVLINLEAAGTLALTGEGDGPADVLRALIAELATSDLTGRIGLIADTQFTDLAHACDPARLQITNQDDLTTQLAQRCEAVDRALAGTGTEDTLQARSDRVAEDVWLPVLYITSPDRPVPAWSGSTVIGLGQPQDGGWVLHVDQTGATLQPLGITLLPQQLKAQDLATLTSLLSTATTTDEPAPQPAVDTEIGDALIALPVDITPTTTVSPTFRVDVLGPITLEGPTAGERLSPRSTELLVYLALRGQATGPELDEALWHGLRVDNRTRNSLVYRTRQRVGPAVLPTTDATGTYRLRDTVACDWTEFQRLTRSGLTDGHHGITQLTAALNLVRDRPFLGVPDSSYTWAEYDLQDMIATIADTAHVLARLHAEAGDHRAALAVATKGLRVDNCSATLHTDAIEAAQALGDHAQATRLLARYEAELAILDPDLV